MIQCCLRGMSVFTHELPSTGKVVSAVMLAKGKAAEVRWFYLVRVIT